MGWTADLASLPVTGPFFGKSTRSGAMSREVPVNGTVSEPLRSGK